MSSVDSSAVKGESLSENMSQCWCHGRPAHSMYLRLTHKLWASYGHALGLSDWRLISRFDCVGTVTFEWNVWLD